MKSLNIVLLCVSLCLMSFGCSKKQTVSEQEIIQQKYKKFVQGMKAHVSVDQHKILEICTKEGGAAVEEIPYRQAEIDYLIKMRLLKLNLESRKYETTALGKELLKT